MSQSRKNPSTDFDDIPTIQVSEDTGPDAPSPEGSPPTQVKIEVPIAVTARRLSLDAGRTTPKTHVNELRNIAVAISFKNMTHSNHELTGRRSHGSAPIGASTRGMKSTTSFDSSSRAAVRESVDIESILQMEEGQQRHSSPLGRVVSTGTAGSDTSSESDESNSVPITIEVSGTAGEPEAAVESEAKAPMKPLGVPGPGGFLSPDRGTSVRRGVSSRDRSAATDGRKTRSRKGTGSSRKARLEAEGAVKVSLSYYERYKNYMAANREIESHFDKETYAQYLDYYYSTYSQYWRIMAALCSTLALLYMIYMDFLFETQPYNKDAIVIVNNKRPEARWGFLACGIICTIVPLVELAFSFTKWHRKHALNAHMIMLVCYGTILSVEEYFVENTFPAQYLLLFHMVMYTSICTPPELISYIGLVTSIVDIVAMSLRMYFSPYAPNFKNNCRSGKEDTANCAQKLLANILVYVASHLFGIYFAHLYDKYTKKTFLKNRETKKERIAFQEATDEAERIALSILPQQVWSDLRGDTGAQIGISMKGQNLIYSYPEVTVLFGDVVGFTNMSSKMAPSDLVMLLDSIFTQFDELISEFGLEKIKTIGDCYMICGGIPERVTNQEIKTVMVGKRMVEIVQKVSKQNNLDLQMRIGVHCGAALAGVLGEEKFIFDVWSKDVSIASLMEQSGKPSQVHISDAIFDKVEKFIKASPGPTVEYQGSPIKTYFVDEITQDPRKPKDASATASQGERSFARLSMNMIRKASISVFGKAAAQTQKAVTRTANLEEEQFDSYMPANWHDPRIGTWLSFTDPNLETEYQIAYIAKCTGKIATSIAFTTLMTAVLVLIDFVAYIHEPTVYLVKMSAMGVEAALFYLVIAKYEEVTTEIRPLRRKIIEISRTLNYQYLGPAVILLLFLTTIPQLTNSAGVMGLMAYHYATLHITIMMSAVFDRLRSLHINAATYAVVIMILANLNGNFFKGNEEDRHMAVTTWGFLILMSLALSWITWRMEYQVRRNYLMKRELAEKRFEIEDIRMKTEKMLYTLLPKEIVQRLKANPDSIIADNIEEAGILFCNVCNFKSIDKESMKVLNDIICKFDQSLEIYQIEKIKSIGTMYMCAAGLYEETPPETNRGVSTSNLSFMDLTNQAKSRYYVRLADFALNLLQRLEQVNEKNGSHYEVRIGIHIGPIVAGVIGRRKFAYDVWGDSVNVASRMESTGRPGRIQVTPRAYELMKDHFEFEHRGLTFVKGKGDMNTYFLKKRKEY